METILQYIVILAALGALTVLCHEIFVTLRLIARLLKADTVHEADISEEPVVPVEDEENTNLVPLSEATPEELWNAKK